MTMYTYMNGIFDRSCDILVGSSLPFRHDKIQPVMFGLEPLTKDFPQLLPQVGLHVQLITSHVSTTYTSSLSKKMYMEKCNCNLAHPLPLNSFPLPFTLPFFYLLLLPHRFPFSTNWNKKPTVSWMTTTPWRTFLPPDTSDLVSQLTPSSTICCGGTAPRGPSRRRS